jgi:hypothetical protein
MWPTASWDQVPVLLGHAEPDQFGLRPLKISVRLTARRLPSLAPQVSQVSDATLVEREAITLPLDQALGFELADVGPAAIGVLRKCRRVDGRGLSGSRSRDGDGPAINGDGISHRDRILRLLRQREGGLHRSPML